MCGRSTEKSNWPHRGMNMVSISLLLLLLFSRVQLIFQKYKNDVRIRGVFQKRRKIWTTRSLANERR